MDPHLLEANQRIQSAIDHLRVELSAIRAGRASPSQVENVPVSAYGSRMKLNEVGTISAPQPSLITVSVWDAGVVQEVVKSLQEANLGITPSWEGQLIRLPIPPLTAERRAEFIKLAHHKMEEAKIEIRQIRQDIREKWEKEEEAGDIGEDEFERRSKILQDLIDKMVKEIDEIVKAKEEELIQL